MSLSTRELEEDETRIDNLLHKVLSASQAIEDINRQIISSEDSGNFDKDYVLERAKKTDILIKTVINIVTLADDIDITDETLTEGLRTETKEKLNQAIRLILDAKKFLGKEE
ncbi:MAG: hypothetical protein ABIC04_04100 [Nanoarchaeota archaeon]